MSGELLSQECEQVGHVEGGDGQVVCRELRISREGQVFSMQVGTADYLVSVRKTNEGLDPDVQVDDAIFVPSAFASVDEICAEISRIPTVELTEYLIPLHPID